jgi:hypothetical protein
MILDKLIENGFIPQGDNTALCQVDENNAIEFDGERFHLQGDQLSELTHPTRHQSHIRDVRQLVDSCKEEIPNLR